MSPLVFDRSTGGAELTPPGMIFAARAGQGSPLASEGWRFSHVKPLSRTATPPGDSPPAPPRLRLFLPSDLPGGLDSSHAHHLVERSFPFRPDLLRPPLTSQATAAAIFLPPALPLIESLPPGFLSEARTVWFRFCRDDAPLARLRSPLGLAMQEGTTSSPSQFS